MLLRRITKHVTDQNWFAVFIDFLIVVVGILIAFQITNWSETRQQEATANIYIERIHGDLLANEEDVNQRIAYFTQTRQHALNALAALDKPSDSLDEQFLVDVYQASQIMPRVLGRDTYDEILSVGANSVMANVEVRKRLANYYRSIQAQNTNLISITPYREIIREGMPYASQAAIRAACDDISTTGPSGNAIIELPNSCKPVMTADEIAIGIMVIKKLNLQKPLVRRISNLDLKLSHANLFIERTKLMEEYLQGLK